MSIKKIAVLSMLVVMLIASNIPASFAQGVEKAGATANVAVAQSAAIGFGPFGGFGFPFNWGFTPLGVGSFPFNWAIGGGWGPFPFLAWNKFSPGFFGITGRFPFSPCFLGGCGIYQSLPFIIGSELGGRPVLGWDVAPWAFGLQSCVRSLPLYFNAHGFGFPKSLGNWKFCLTPPVCPAPIPAIAPVASLPVAGIGAGIGKGISKAAVGQAVPFIIGSELGGRPVLGWDVAPWAFGLQSCVRSLPLYFNAHGFGFPFSLGNYRIGFIPSIC
ncbi:hypothetical protein Mtc_1374 [Methanocella conradii HZ254]|uniref:Uncharacterized protein n=1 Tax=Methanocella conradii (strain DSM 24694 / JCM 17849 / CGMCC 1.5162 / HZ254) TaxID=1041930 RepID=H8IAN1_METCZ|nr:hypothetical protein [Methanocella conradii]AFD00128.1 hypothetical protein Mtc_1374 [Methanocella conradii HZ254]